MTSTMEKITSLIKQYDVDVIEVVGHTDEQGYGPMRVPPRLSAESYQARDRQ